MKKLQEIFESSLMEILSNEDSGVQPDDIAGIVADMVPNVSDSIAESMLERIKKDAPSGLKAKEKDQRQFEKRLRKRWERPLSLLDLFISLAFEAGASFNDEFREDAARSHDVVFEALTLLHARSCQIG